MLDAVVTASLSFLVFTFGSMLVAIQIAGGQLTPRIIATTLLRDNVVRYTVGLFIFTLMFALGTGNRLETGGHQFIIFVAACLGICCVAAFLYLIDYAARLMRPITILTLVAKNGLSVIREAYPEATPGRDGSDAGPRRAWGARPYGSAPGHVGDRGRHQCECAAGAGRGFGLRDRIGSAGRRFRRQR